MTPEARGLLDRDQRCNRRHPRSSDTEEVEFGDWEPGDRLCEREREVRDPEPRST